MSSLLNLNITELMAKILNFELSATELVNASLKTIEKKQSDTNAFITYNQEKSLALAKSLDSSAKNGKFLGPLHGIPIALKDNYLTIDFPTTAGSKANLSNMQLIDSTVAAKLRYAGAIILGKTNMHEWAYGAINNISASGMTKNPWDNKYITGGSSGGSAAAVGAKMVAAAFGSDTAGSIRIPSSCCGISGIKPSYGLVSCFGILPLSFSLDVPGPMAKSAADLAVLLNVIQGIDEKDNNTLLYKKVDRILPNNNRYKLAIPRADNLDWNSDVDSIFMSAINNFKDTGTHVEEVAIKNIKEAANAFSTIQSSEATFYHNNFSTKEREKYSVDLKNKLSKGNTITATDYLKAKSSQSVFKKQLSIIFHKFDALVLPTLPVKVPEINQNIVKINGKEISTQNAMIYLTWIANLTGMPAVSIPCGKDKNNLPVGLMLIGSCGDDYKLLNIAKHYQQEIQSDNVNYL